MIGRPFIPENIVVHLGAPDEKARNVTVSFPEYIKNVASSEIYPTWPESALRANIYAQISFALNRYYTEWYRSQGYDFDITSTTAYDQSFVYGRSTFENIDAIVDEIFNSYVVRQGRVEPLFTSYCSGNGVDCDGLKQWETVSLAQKGLTSYEILQYYYGNDIDIVTNVPVRLGSLSYPGAPLKKGDTGPAVQEIQLQLNRIRKNFPAIPAISPADGVFGDSTETAVKSFQSVFSLVPDGIVGNATWYKIAYIYSSVKKLSELGGEGVKIEDLPQGYIDIITYGSPYEQVIVVQYFLSVISRYYDTVPYIEVDGVFGPQTENAVRNFQQTFGLTADGVIDFGTWNEIYNAYRGIILENPISDDGILLFPGIILLRGSSGEYVSALQKYLNGISDIYPEIPKLAVDGIFGEQTDRAVRTFQRLYGLTENGIVGTIVWNKITDVYRDIKESS